MKYPRRAPGPTPTCAISCQNSPCPDAPPRFPAPEELQFSPSLLFLLSLVYRDGFVDRETFGMLRDMLPYLGQEDARAARSSDSSMLLPVIQPSRKKPVNVSPAAVVSTALVGTALW